MLIDRRFKTGAVVALALLFYAMVIGPPLVALLRR